MTSVEKLYEEMMADFTARTGVSVIDSCDLAARMYALAAQVHALQVESDWVRRQCFPQTAQGENLDHHAQMRALSRKQATRATGVVRFFVQASAEISRTIPQGTVCMTAGLVRFETTQEGSIAPGELWAEVPVRAVEPGAGGNVGAGTITEMAVAPVGVSSCTNPQDCTGGVEEEDDESLRQRVMETFRALPNGANAAFYRQVALADEEVAAAVVVPRPRGVGTVDVVVASHAGPPSQTLRNRLKAKLDEVREIAVDLQVIAPTLVRLSLKVQVKAGAGYDAAAVRAGVEQALRGCFTGALLGQNVLRAWLGSIIFACEGVENYTLVAPAADTAVTGTQLPVLLSLVVEEMA